MAALHDVLHAMLRARVVVTADHVTHYLKPRPQRRQHEQQRTALRHHLLEHIPKVEGVRKACVRVPEHHKRPREAARWASMTGLIGAAVQASKRVPRRVAHGRTRQHGGKGGVSRHHIKPQRVEVEVRRAATRLTVCAARTGLVLRCQFASVASSAEVEAPLRSVRKLHVQPRPV